MNKMWEPEFDGWHEDRVSLSSCELSTHSTSRNEYGVIMQVGDDEGPYAGDAAIFWTDPLHLYFRYDWGQWYKVSNDDPGNCANICKRNTATLLLCTTSSIKYHPVRIYHIDRLPKELFGEEPDDVPSRIKMMPPDFDQEIPRPPVFGEDDDDTPSSLQDKPDSPSTGTDEEEEVEMPSDESAEKMLLDGEIQATVDVEIAKYGGRVYSRSRFYNNRLYSFDFAQIGKRFFTIVYANFCGDWLGDEDTFAGELPLWFSETEHTVSPVYQAMKCCSFFRKELPQIKIDSIVVLPKKCIIINDEEMQRCWRDKYGTTVVRTRMIGETSLKTLDAHLASQPVDESEVPELDVVEIVGIASCFIANPENWIDKN